MEEDELFDDLEQGIVEGESQPVDSEDYSEPQQSDATEIDLTSEVLQSKGIDPSNIIFVDDYGQTYSKDWNDLTIEELKNILSYQPDPELDLDDNEIDLINRIRQAGQNPIEYINNLVNANIPEETISNRIDDLSDEQVYMLHLDILAENSGKELTDDELLLAVEEAKLNEEMFATQVEGLRNQFRELENQAFYEKQQQQEQAIQQQYAQFEDSILDEIDSIDSFAGHDLELSVDDKNDLASFILDRDETGTSEFGRMLSDPRVLVQLAFLAQKGGEVFSNLEGSYLLQMRDEYNKGYMAATGKYGNSVYIKPTQSKQDDVLTLDNAFDDYEW